MAIHIIIDGYNLIRRSSYFSTFDQRDLALGRETLIHALSAYRRLRPHKITVVFDGARAIDDSWRRERISGITVEFSRHGEEADQVIKRLADRERERALVVSSDRDIVTYAESRGASTIGAAAFEAKILMAASDDMEPAAGDGESGGWTPSTKKRGPRRRLPKKKRHDLRRFEKL